MKKFIAVLVAVTMVVGLANPTKILAVGGGNPFDDDFPIDIPIPTDN